MPRRIEINRCQQCRSRRIKCDGHRPRCTRCQRGNRDCHWIGDAPTPSLSSQPSINHPSPRDPELALQDAQVAEIFRHYIGHLAGWYDLNDNRRHFEDVVPIRARHNPLLLSAILAFSAAHQYRTMDQAQYLDIAEFYHYESVRRLISLTQNIDELPIGESLASICLLRSYEIITQNVNAQSHLQGCYSLLASRQINLTSDLLSSGFWNYLREDITASLIEHRSLMIDLSSQHFYPNAEEDADHANHITLLLGKVINQCLAVDSPALSVDEWQAMGTGIQDWKASLPLSFDVIQTPGLKDASSFPPLWTIRDWHTSSLHYYHTAMSILCLAEPSPEPLNTLQRVKNMNDLHHKLDHHATEVCALAVSSDSSPVWVNAFGPIAFCAPWLQDPVKQKDIIGHLETWSKVTGWPVSSIVNALSNPSATY